MHCDVDICLINVNVFWFICRDAFVAASGNTLIVADYGQLELRLMAHMTNCKVGLRLGLGLAYVSCALCIMFLQTAIRT